MVHLQQVIDQANSADPPRNSMVDLGHGVCVFTRWQADEGRLRVDYTLDGFRVASAYLDSHLAPRVDVYGITKLDPIGAVMVMAVINLANSRASQMAYVANLKRPVIAGPGDPGAGPVTKL